MRQAMITREGLSNLAEQFNMERGEVAGKIVGLTVGRHREGSAYRGRAPSSKFAVWDGIQPPNAHGS